MEVKKVILTHLIYWMVLAVIFATEFTYRQPLYDLSIDVILDMQPNRNLAGRIVFEGLSYLGAGALYFLMFLLIFNWGSRAHAFYYIIFICACLFYMNLGKIVYHDPRPYMSNSKILPLGCSNEYGNPSGHALFASGFFFFLFLDIFHGIYSYS